MSPSSKRNAKEALGIVAFLLSFVVLGVCIGIQPRSAHPAVGIFVGVLGFFGLNLLSIRFLIETIPTHGMVNELSIQKTLDALPLQEIQLKDANAIYTRFVELGYTNVEDTYLKQTKFSFWKDRITFYVRCVPSVQLKSSLQKESQKFWQRKFPSGDVCFFLFLIQEEVSEEDRMRIKEMGKRNYIQDTFHLKQRSSRSILPILVDRSQGIGYYFAPKSRTGIHSYACGCRRIQTVFDSRSTIS